MRARVVTFVSIRYSTLSMTLPYCACVASFFVKHGFETYGFETYLWPKETVQ